MLRPFFEVNELKHFVFSEIFYFWKFDCFHVYMKTVYRYKQRLDENGQKDDQNYRTPQTVFTYFWARKSISEKRSFITKIIF